MSKLDISPLVKLTEQAACGPGSHFWKLRPQLAEQYDVPALMEYDFRSGEAALVFSEQAEVSFVEHDQ